MHEIVFNVLPIFILIFIGWLTVKAGVMKAGIGEALSDFVFKLAVPVLMFHTIVQADFQGASPFRLWLAYFAGVGVAWTLGHLAATLIFGRDARIGVLAGLSSAFANNVFIGLPLVGRIVGADGLVALSILLAVHLPLMMVIGTVMMENAERKAGTGQAHGLIFVLKQVGRNLLTNPLVIGLEAGIAAHLVSLPIPGPLESVLSQISSMAGPAALISLGMALTRYGVSGNLGITSVTTVLKLVLMPAVVWTACHFLSLSHEWTLALVLTSSVPTGVNAWLIANRFGIGHSLAASTITVTTALGVLSVSAWAWLLGA
ncbi:AEC family transporter [Rhizobium paknamense]|uniref:Permease n=1 Tax=Rhizobium paknamense TaxID=1206817 RepID=A0ABU0IBD2_9HYPH|nr:AEC family transporter [Rhizobium paknamense]MDQ0455533.1 putative permease [Rhizobium paknamense]